MNTNEHELKTKNLPGSIWDVSPALRNYSQLLREWLDCRILQVALESMPEGNVMSEKYRLDNGTRISRREALQKGLYGASGLLLGSRLVNDAHGAVTQPAPAAKAVKAKSV